MLKRSGTIRLLSLTLLIAGSVDSIRNFPASALFGTSLLFFLLLAAIIFLIPVGLISAELSSNNQLSGGIYAWVKAAMGTEWALVAIWLQWLGAMVWFPTILSFLAATLAYPINPALAHNKIYLVSSIVVIFWLLTGFNAKGIKASTWLSAGCAIMGLIVPVVFLLGLALVWIVKGNPIQIHFTPKNWLPILGQKQAWTSLTALMTAFLGMELATVHVKDVLHPQKTFPRAFFLSVLFILLTMLCGSLAIALLIPASKINLVAGIMQIFEKFFTSYHLKWMLPYMAGMVFLGALGSIINWMISPAKGLLQAAQDGYFPKILTKTNKNNVAINLLILQGILVSVSCSAFILMPSVNGSYWLLTDLSTEIAISMYVLMFLAAIKLKNQFHSNLEFVIPGGKLSYIAICLLGLLGCGVTLLVGFFPPNDINVGSFWHYESIFSLGILIFLSPILLLWGYKNTQRKKYFNTDLP